MAHCCIECRMNRCNGELPLLGLCYNSDRYSPRENPHSFQSSSFQGSVINLKGEILPLLPFRPYYGGDMLYTAERRFVRPNPGKLTGRGLKAKALASGVAYVQCPSSIQDISWPSTEVENLFRTALIAIKRAARKKVLRSSFHLGAFTLDF